MSNKDNPVYLTGNKEAMSNAIASALHINDENTQEENYSTIYQGTATNTLTKIRAKEGANGNTVVDPITGTATITRGTFSITIPAYAELSGFRTSTHQLLDILTIKLTEAGAKSPQVSISLDEFMSLRCLKDGKEARKQVNADLETLFNAKISFKEKRGKGKTENYLDMRLIDSKGIQKGIIYASFGSTFYELLKGYPVMPYPTKILSINSKRNPGSYYLYRKIAEYKNMNVGKVNDGDIISVKTLLDSNPNILTYEEVANSNRNFTDRIIQPFERDMDNLKDSFKWEYCKSKGEPLSDQEATNMKYDDFVNLNVKITWLAYPDQSERLKKKEQETKKKTKKKQK
jgi:hypothetical protein